MRRAIRILRKPKPKPNSRSRLLSFVAKATKSGCCGGRKK